MAETKALSPKTANLVVWIGLSVALLAVLAWNYYTFVGNPWGASATSADCIKVEAVVTESHASVSTSRKSHDTYYASFDYEVDGQKHSGKEEITSNIYNTISAGSKLDICYMKGHPDRVAVIGNDVKGEHAFYVIILDIIVLVVIVRLIWAGMKKGKQAA